MLPIISMTLSKKNKMKVFVIPISLLLCIQLAYGYVFDVDLDSEATMWAFASNDQKYEILFNYIKLSNQSLSIPLNSDGSLIDVKECVDETYYNRWVEFLYDLKLYPVVSSCFNQIGWIR